MRGTAFGLAVAAAFAACGGTALESSPKGGSPEDAGAIDGTPGFGSSSGSGSSSGAGGSSSSGSSSGSTPQDGGPGLDATMPGQDASTMGPPVDGGYYYGDGSFWVEGGAYPDTGTEPQDGSSPTIDAGAGCASLAACCPTLQSSQQGLCNDVVAQGNASDCAAELSQLQTTGNCTGANVLASQVQVAPNLMVSDGSLLFWTTASTPGLLAMPVGGGPITVLLDGPITNQLLSANSPDVFLAVDGTNLYLLQNDAILRVPKNGSPPSLINGGGLVLAVTALGGNAYWMEYDGNNYGYETLPVVVNAAPLLGGPVSQIASFPFANPPVLVGVDIGVTNNTVFVGARGQFLSQFSIGSPGAPSPVAAGEACNLLTSDVAAVYCAQNAASNIALSSNGSSTALGSAVNASTIVFDDTYAYWADMTSVGTIMKAPKAGGGSATVLAYDTNPTAIAVDANSVYWADQGGYIKSIPK